MADGFIVRRGGRAADQTATPSILDFSTVSLTSIKFKLRNNDAATATLVYRFNTLTGDGESISVAANTTTNEITLTVSEFISATKLFVTANAVGKIKSEVAEQEFATAAIFTAATGGTTEEYDDGGKRYKSHTFTSNGTFEVTTVGNGDRNQVDYLVIAGGGGGQGQIGGAGGAGGYRTTNGTSGRGSSAESKVTVTATTYGVTVGLGGNSRNDNGGQASNGANSSIAFSPTVTSLGGGGGGSRSDFSGTGNSTGATGGSGGGGGINPGLKGDGTADQGFDGGAGSGSGNNSSAGGGGAGQAGADGTGNTGGNGGNGLANLLRTGSNETRGGGGGGAADQRAGSAVFGQGGTGGGGSSLSGQTAESGTANTGGGGGAGTISPGEVFRAGGNGGSGIVIIRYEIAPSV